MAYLRANAFSRFFFFSPLRFSAASMYVKLKAPSLLYNHHHKLKLTF